MAVSKPAAEALAGLAMSASLMEALLKRGVIEQQDVDPIVSDAASYVAAFCTDCGAEVEREALRLLALVGKSGRDAAPPEPSPIPVVDPAGS
jgi:hypothetical protein